MPCAAARDIATRVPEDIVLEVAGIIYHVAEESITACSRSHSGTADVHAVEVVTCGPAHYVAYANNRKGRGNRIAVGVQTKPHHVVLECSTTRPKEGRRLHSNAHNLIPGRGGGHRGRMNQVCFDYIRCGIQCEVNVNDRARVWPCRDVC